MNNVTTVVMQLGVALLIVFAIAFLAVGFAVTGLMVGDSVFVLMLIGLIWLGVRLRMEAVYKVREQERLMRSLVWVRARGGDLA